MFGRTFNTFLLDSKVNGRIKYSMPFWTGLVFKIPRTLVNESTDREEYKFAGVYFLLGQDEGTGKQIVYIGQAIHRKNGEGLINRLKEHIKDPSKDYWNEAIIVTTVDDALGPTEISYLEHTFCKMAIEAKRYIVKNGNDPNVGHPSEEIRDALDGFIQTSRMIIGYAQHKFLEPLIDPATKDKDLLYLKYNGASGIGKLTSEGFVILKGSTLRSGTTDSCPSSCLSLREKYKDLIKNDIVEDDLLFSTPAAAAVFLCGASISAPAYWKNAEGVPLKDIIGLDSASPKK